MIAKQIAKIDKIQTKEEIKMKAIIATIILALAFSTAGAKVRCYTSDNGFGDSTTVCEETSW